MTFSQFVEIPPLEDVNSFFTAATGCPFKLDVQWSKWLQLDPDDVLCFVPYIRKCHQKIIIETLNKLRDPCALLRQLLRPYGYCIDFYRKKYTLVEIKEDLKTVGKKEGATVTWSG